MTKTGIQATDFTALKILSPKESPVLGQGAFYIGGMTNAQFEQLCIYTGSVTPDGTIAYLTDKKEFNFKQAGKWLTLNSVPPESGIFFTGDTGTIKAGQLLALTENENGNFVVNANMQINEEGDLLVNGKLEASDKATLKQGLTVAGESEFTGKAKFTGKGNKPLPENAKYTLYDEEDAGSRPPSNDVVNVPDISIECDGNVIADKLYTWTPTGSVSSIKIKDVLKSDDVGAEAFELFKQIPFKKYQYKDKAKFHNGILYGVIAEELKEVLPHAVVENVSGIHDNSPYVIKENVFELGMTALKKLIEIVERQDQQIQELKDQINKS